jgi:hypothetical protein
VIVGHRTSIEEIILKGGYFMKKKLRLIAVSLILLLTIYSVFACSHLQKKEEGDLGINYNLSPDVEITKVSYFLKKLEGAPRLFFEIGIKNISKEAHKYRVTVLTSDGPSGSALYPVKGKLDPGKDLGQAFPLFFSNFPKGFTLNVETYD